MASPFQQQALRRKLIYLGLIVVLFTIAGIFRVVVVEAKGKELAIREQDLGEVEVGSSALQLSLTGSRGFVVCGLWYWAMDAQKKNRWNELELYVDSLTRLQPHFISPWLFQSWNLSYNVYATADQAKDKYFYAGEGALLLCKGERKNHFNPDMRYSIGFYQQHKIMMSDETNYMRCLYQLSCIPPPQRDPARFEKEGADGKKTLNLEEFERFCIAHPQFVRRLHDRLRCDRPEDAIRFLRDNQHIPTIYKDDAEEVGPEWRAGHFPLREVSERFPAMPPPAHIRRTELPQPEGMFDLYDVDELSYESLLDDNFNGYDSARAWFSYAQEALPEPSKEWPGENEPIVDRTRQRKSKMTVNLFRNHPCRAQSAVGERLQDEGWSGPEGWTITGWFPKDRFHDGKPAKVGSGNTWAEDAWSKAFALWERRGKRSLLLLDPQELADLQAKSLAFQATHKQPMGAGDAYGPEPPLDTHDHEGWHAAKFMWQYNYARTLPNFPHWYYDALVEKDPRMIEARRTMFEARQRSREGRRDKAVELLQSETGLRRLRLILETYPLFREDQNNQEEFYELQVRYMKLVQDKEGGLFKPLMAAGQLVGTGLPHGAAGSAWPGAVNLMLTSPSLLSNMPVPEFIPGDDIRIDVTVPGPAPTDPPVPLIAETVQMTVKARQGLIKITPNMTPPQMRGGQNGGPPPGMMGPPPGQ